MMIIFFLLSFTLSLMTKTITHPISFMAIIMTQTLIICFISTFFNSSPWFAFILFLVFIGGVMVLFIYMASLASNENFLWDFKETLFIFPILSLTFIIILFTSPLFTTHINFNFLSFLSHLYSIKFSPFMICLIIYLLITLLVVSNIIKKNKAPIRALK